MTMDSGAKKLRDLMARPKTTVVPLALDPLSACMAEASGFEAIYLSGGTLGYVKTSTEAHLSLSQLVDVGVEIRAASTLPLILDGQCGWGDPMHMDYTMRLSEAAGFAGIEIEDQLAPKRVHHHVGIEHSIPTEMMVEKIRVAVAARRDPDFVIIARTNVHRSHGIDEAIRRLEAYKRAGADVLLVTSRDPDELRKVGERVEGPHLHFGMVRAPAMPLDEFARLGYKLFVDIYSPIVARVKATRLAYEAMAAGTPDPTLAADWAVESTKLHELIGLERLLEIERRTVER